SSKLREK
ncbi:unnamed protein product, partial [Allacma fusca]